MENWGAYISYICGAASKHHVMTNPAFVSASLAVKVQEGIALALDPPSLSSQNDGGWGLHSEGIGSRELDRLMARRAVREQRFEVHVGQRSKIDRRSTSKMC